MQTNDVHWQQKTQHTRLLLQASKNDDSTYLSFYTLVRAPDRQGMFCRSGKVSILQPTKLPQ